MKDLGKFYEEYWSYRERDFDYRKMGILPDRFKIAVGFVSEDLLQKQKDRILLLDIGCGEGITGELLRGKLGNRVSTVGLDISEGVLKQAEQFYDEIYQIDVDSESLLGLFNGRKFDYIVCLEVIEHIMYPDRLLEEISQLLEQDGKLIASIPNFVFYRNRLTVLRGGFPRQHVFHPSEHIHYFTFDSFKRLLKMKGFTICRFHSDFALPKYLSILPASVQRRVFTRFPNLFGKCIVYFCASR
jgi:2-polyprenyl-3-methyl-5-hydroxy-6-metoxy-1,4-benzoquinol methylase